MSRKYTAQEMREAADGLKDDPGMDALIIADMLRQAADELERKRKYEYAVRATDSYGTSLLGNKRFADISQARCVCNDAYMSGLMFLIVRREIGEWEEVE